MRTWLWAAFPKAPHLVKSCVNSGYLGVDLFFVLSGYVISLRYSERFRESARTNYLPFILKRFARIFPAYLFALLACFAIWSFFVAYDVPYHAMEERFRPVDFLKSLFLVQSWGYPIEKRWNIPDWSVSAEWLAYLLFPVFMKLPFGKTTWRKFLLIVAIGCVNIGLFSVWKRTGAESIGLWRILIAFPIGMALQRMAWGPRAPSFSSRHLGWGLFLFAGPLFELSRRTGLDPLLWTPFWCAGVIFLLAAPTPSKRPFRAVSLLHLGHISYSIYLTHDLLLLVLRQIVSSRQLADFSGATATSFLTLVVCLMVLSGHALYTYVESPGRTWILSLFRARLARAANLDPPTLAPVSRSP